MGMQCEPIISIVMIRDKLGLEISIKDSVNRHSTVSFIF